MTETRVREDGDSSAFFQIEASHKLGTAIVGLPELTFNATVSATTRLARRNLFACTVYDGPLAGLQPRGCPFDPGRLHLTSNIISSYVN